MRLIYIAHPFGGDDAKLVRAKLWYGWLLRQFPRNAYDMNWAIEAELLDDSISKVRTGALLRSREHVKRCDGVVLVGGQITDGMRHDADGARRVVDLTPLGPLPPPLNTHAWITTNEIALAAGFLDGAFSEAKLDDIFG